MCFHYGYRQPASLYSHPEIVGYGFLPWINLYIELYGSLFAMRFLSDEAEDGHARVTRA